MTLRLPLNTTNSARNARRWNIAAPRDQNADRARTPLQQDDVGKREARGGPLGSGSLALAMGTSGRAGTNRKDVFHRAGSNALVEPHYPALRLAWSQTFCPSRSPINLYTTNLACDRSGIKCAGHDCVEIALELQPMDVPKPEAPPPKTPVEMGR
jgi:hypothetical protein